MFRDEAIIEVIAGKGGDGLVSFRHEKYVPQGGPDGGDGGRGGSVILIASRNQSSLLRVGRQFRYAARKGQPGGPKRMTGAGGDDLIVEVPIGTQIIDLEHGNMLRDLDTDGAELVVAKGGRGGKGNIRFANSIRQVPRKATNGTEGETRNVRLELKLFAEVGLVGLPNAGKSTLLSRVTAARPKIADYPFTTLDPQVAIATVGDYDTLVLADLPGLIEGASDGHGLGHQFLRHVERCKVLMHLVDVTALADPSPEEAWAIVHKELEAFSPKVAEKPCILIATKVEDDSCEERIQALESAAGCPVLRISSVRGLGLDELMRQAWKLVHGVEKEDWED